MLNNYASNNGGAESDGNNIKGVPSLPSVVLRHVFRNVGATTLKQCRLVCSDWNKEAGTVLKRISVCTPDNSGEIAVKSRRKDYCEFFLSNTTFKSNSTILPPLNMHLKEELMSTDRLFVDSDVQLVTEWLQQNGHHLRGLRYTFKKHGKSGENNYNFFMKVISELCPNLEELEIQLVDSTDPVDANFENLQLPKLKSLVFNDRPQCSSSMCVEVASPLCPFIPKLFEAAVNLESVCVFAKSFSFDIVSSLRKYGKNVKHLIWKNVLYDSEWNEFLSLPQETKLQTLELSCRLFPSPNLGRNIFNLLQKHSESLQKLILRCELFERWIDNSYIEEIEVDEDFEPGDGDGVFGNVNDLQFNNDTDLPFVQLRFPILQKLFTLEISDIFHFRLPENLFSFVSNMPNLKVLRLKNVTYASNVHPLKPDEVLQELLSPDAVFPSARYVHLGLKEFYLEGEIMNTGTITRISNNFPNLKVLQIEVISDSVFYEIFETYKKRKLEDLSLEIRGLQDMGRCQSVMINCLPLMSDLKKLKLSFEDNGCFSHACFQLHARTVFNGFCQTPSLRWIELTNFSFSSAERDSIINCLKQHCASVIFKKCVLYTPSFDASYNSWSTNNPMPVVDVRIPTILENTAN